MYENALMMLWTRFRVYQSIPVTLQSTNNSFQVRKDYDLIKRKTNFTIIEASRDDVLAQKRKDPDPKEAFRYYQVLQSIVQKSL